MSASQILSLTTSAAREAARLYFEPLQRLFQLSRRPVSSVTEDLPAFVLSELKYQDVDHYKTFLKLKHSLNEPRSVSLLFAKEDRDYAVLLGETLKSRELTVFLTTADEDHLEWRWDPSSHLDVFIVSHHFSTLHRWHTTSGRPPARAFDRFEQA